VSLAGVLDLVACAERGVGDMANAVVGFLGGWPDERPDVYAAASPAASLSLAVPRLVVHGWRDSQADLVDVGRRYAPAAAAAGDPVELVELDGDDHFSIIDPSSPGWRSVADRIEAWLAE
jgi:acetyl esterase/lipase